VPFTHHVTVTEDAVSNDEDEDVGEIGDVGSVDAVSVPTTVEDGTDVQRRGSQKSSKKEAEVKRKRFTHLFSIKRRKSEEVAATPPRDHRPEQQKSNDHAKEKEKHEREIEMRRKELERREAELAEGMSSVNRMKADGRTPFQGAHPGRGPPRCRKARLSRIIPPPRVLQFGIRRYREPAKDGPARRAAVEDEERGAGGSKGRLGEAP
jgi:hypothetical protein